MTTLAITHAGEATVERQRSLPTHRAAHPDVTSGVLNTKRFLRVKNEFSGTRVHLIGIGGSGMSGAATLLLKLGASVSGSDLQPFEGLGELVRHGARVSIGHREQQLDVDVDLVVISAAIPKSNPELAAARTRGIRVIKYAELIGALMNGCGRGVAIAGTHGKSTTTAMCVHLCRQAGLNPSFLVGARSRQLGGSSGVGTGPHFIVESCEFDRSFLHLAPESAAILNIEPDHLDCYHDLDEIVEAFARFGRNVDPEGLLVCNGDDRWAKKAAAPAKAQVQTFGFAQGADWRAVNLRSPDVYRGCYTFDVQFRSAPFVSTRLSIPGCYNVMNALAAFALAHHAGADVRALAHELPNFAGVNRRLSFCGEGHGITVIDDYAHHPTEIRVTIEAARCRYRPKRTWVIFQPHQHSRTHYLMDEFAESFNEADEIVVPDVYEARKTSDEGVGQVIHLPSPSLQPMVKAAGQRPALPGSKELVTRIRRSGGRARYLPNLDAVADHLLEHLVEGDLVLTMGAGDIWKVADELVARICGLARA